MSVNQKSVKNAPSRKVVRKNLLSMHEDISSWSHMLQDAFLPENEVQTSTVASVHQQINAYSNKYRPLSMSFQQWQKFKSPKENSEIENRSVATQELDIHKALQHLAFQLQFVSSLELQLKNDDESGVHVHGDQQLKSEIEQLLLSTPTHTSSDESMDDPFSAKLDYILEDKEESLISSIEGSETISNASEVAVDSVSVESECQIEGLAMKHNKVEQARTLSFLTKLKSTSVDDVLNCKDFVNDKLPSDNEDNVFSTNVEQDAAVFASLEQKLSFSSNEKYQTTSKEVSEAIIESSTENELSGQTTEFKSQNVFVEKETVTTSITQMATIIHLAADRKEDKEPEKIETLVSPLSENDSMTATEHNDEAVEGVSLLHDVSENGVSKDTELISSHSTATDANASVTSDSMHAIEVVENEFSNISDTGHSDDNGGSSHVAIEFENTTQESNELLTETARCSNLKKDEVQSVDVNEETIVEKVFTDKKHSVDNDEFTGEVDVLEVNEIFESKSPSHHEETPDLLNEAILQETTDVVEVLEMKNQQQISSVSGDQILCIETSQEEALHQLGLSEEEVADDEAVLQVDDVNTSEEGESDSGTEPFSSAISSDVARQVDQMLPQKAMLSHPDIPGSLAEPEQEVEQDFSTGRNSSSEIIDVSNEGDDSVSMKVARVSVITKHGVNAKESSYATSVDEKKTSHEVVVLEKLSLSSSEDFNQLSPAKNIFVEEVGQPHAADAVQTNTPVKVLYVEESESASDEVVSLSEASSLEKAVHAGSTLMQLNQLTEEIVTSNTEEESLDIDSKMHMDTEDLSLLQESLELVGKKAVSMKSDDSPMLQTDTKNTGKVYVKSEISSCVVVERQLQDSDEVSMQPSKTYHEDGHDVMKSNEDHINLAMSEAVVTEESHSLSPSNEIDSSSDITKVQALLDDDHTAASTTSDVCSPSAEVASATSLTTVAFDQHLVKKIENDDSKSSAQDHTEKEVAEKNSVPFGTSSANITRRSKVLFEQRKLLFERNSDASNEHVSSSHHISRGKISPKIKKLQSLGSPTSTGDGTVTNTHELNTTLETSIETSRVTTTKKLFTESTSKTFESSTSLISAQPFKFGYNKASHVTPLKKVTFLSTVSSKVGSNSFSMPSSNVSETVTQASDKTSSPSFEPTKSPKLKVSPKPAIAAKPIKAFKPKFVSSSEKHFSKESSGSTVVTKRWNSEWQTDSPVEAPVIPNLSDSSLLADAREKPDTVSSDVTKIQSSKPPLVPPIPDESTMKEMFSDKGFGAPLPFSASSNKPKFKPMRFGLNLKTRTPSDSSKPSEKNNDRALQQQQQSNSTPDSSNGENDLQSPKECANEVTNCIEFIPDITNSIEADAKSSNKNTSEAVTNSENERCIETAPSSEDRVSTTDVFVSAPLHSTTLESEIVSFPNSEFREDESSCLNALDDVSHSSPNIASSSDNDDCERAYTDDDIDTQSGEYVLDPPKAVSTSMTIASSANDSIVNHSADTTDVSVVEEKSNVAIAPENDRFESALHDGEGTLKPSSEDFVSPPLPPPPSEAVYTSKAHFKVTSPTPRPVQKTANQEPSWSSSYDDFPLPPPPSDLPTSPSPSDLPTSPPPSNLPTSPPPSNLPTSPPPPSSSTSSFLQSDKPKGFRSVARPVLKLSKQNGSAIRDRVHNNNVDHKQANGSIRNSAVSINNHIGSLPVPCRNSSTQHQHLLGSHVTLLRDTRKILIKPANSSHGKETTQNTYSIQGNPLPVAPSADTQVTPKNRLPDGAVYQTTSKDGDVVHTDTYYPATDQSDPKSVVLERTKTTTIVQAPHHQGIGPVSDSGVPYALRTTVDDSKHWYKNMFKQMHKVGNEDDAPHQASVGKPHSVTSGADRHASVGISKPTKVGRITDYQPAAPYVVENKPVKLNLNQAANIHTIRSSSSNANRNNNTSSGEIRRSASLEDFSNIQWDDFFDDIYKPKPDSATSSTSHTNISYKSSPTPTTAKSYSASYSSNAKDSMPELKRTTPAVNKASSKSQPQKDEDVRLPARAKFDFAPQTAKEYAMKKGQTVIVTKQVDDNWYMVQSVDGARGGIVPVSYVEVISGSSPEKPRRNGQAKAKFDFVGSTKNELSFKKGDDIILLKKVDDNWYKGKLSGKTGILPVAYVEVTMEPEVEAPKENPVLKQLTPKSNASHSHQSSALSQASSDEPDEKERKERAAFLAQTVVGTKASLHHPEGHAHREDFIDVEPEVVKKVNTPSVDYKSPSIQKSSNQAEEILNFSELDQAVEALSSGNQEPHFSPASQSTASPPSSLLSPPSSIVTPSIPSYPSSNISTQPSSPHLSTPPVNDYGQVIGCYVTLYAYEASNDDELDLQPGDLVMVVETCDDGWYVGTCQRTGAFGTFPGNYVSLTNTT